MKIPPQKTRLTQQRRSILSLIKSACYHPTAEQIHALVKKKLPAISVGTVYRNLDVLERESLIRKISLPNQPARYRAGGKNVAYFVCRKTGAIYDLEIDPKKIVRLLMGHPAVDSVEDFSLLAFGLAREGHNEPRLRKGRLNSPFSNQPSHA